MRLASPREIGFTRLRRSDCWCPTAQVVVSHLHNRWVKPPYSAELEALPSTYEQARELNIAELRGTLGSMGAGPAVFVGSGGTVALATLAARLHEHVLRQPANICTALELLDLPQLRQRGALLFSSSAKHPDAQRALGEFRRGRFSPAAVLTHRTASDLAQYVSADTAVLTLPRPPQPDGFLATGSIIQMATLLLRGYLGGADLPAVLPERRDDEAPLRDEVIVLTPPSLASVAADLEVRLVEPGLATVQVTDFRNFAHGRHTGFSRRMERTTVIVLSDGESRLLAEATADALPRGADVRRWFVDAPWPSAVIELLARSMRLAGAVGAAAGLDVARPSVPPFGRRLYRLPLERKAPKRLVGGVERKLLALGVGVSEPTARVFADAGAEWLAGVQEQSFAAITLDYDGTVCWTPRRFELPDEHLQAALLELLDRGAVVGFASGRGRSLHADLRRWIPSSVWSNVRVGLYNGAVRLWLNEELDDLRQATAWSAAVVDAIDNLPKVHDLTVEERGAQVTVQTCLGRRPDATLVDTVRNCLQEVGVAANVVASGHSLDIINNATHKSQVSLDLEGRTDGSVLAVGDQGQLGGNDHELLASTQWSLTVSEGSADPTRCWFAGSGDRVGPDLLAFYLKSLRKQRRGFAVRGLGIR